MCIWNPILAVRHCWANQGRQPKYNEWKEQNHVCYRPAHICSLILSHRNLSDNLWLLKLRLLLILRLLLVLRLLVLYWCTDCDGRVCIGSIFRLNCWRVHFILFYMLKKSFFIKFNFKIYFKSSLFITSYWIIIFFI